MPERVRLFFNRNRDPRTEFYYIYRSYSPSIYRFNRRVMKVRHPFQINPVIVKAQSALKLSEKEFQLPHRYVLLDKPFSIYINGTRLLEGRYVVDSEKGIIYTDSVYPTESITVDYSFDGIEIFDDELKQNDVLDYYGPKPDVSRSLYYAVEARGEDNRFSVLSKPFQIQ